GSRTRTTDTWLWCLTMYARNWRRISPEANPTPASRSSYAATQLRTTRHETLRSLGVGGPLGAEVTLWDSCTKSTHDPHPLLRTRLPSRRKPHCETSRRRSPSARSQGRHSRSRPRSRPRGRAARHWLGDERSLRRTDPRVHGDAVESALAQIADER